MGDFREIVTELMPAFVELPDRRVRNLFRVQREVRERYRLVVARACPWANRAIIVRRLLGLEDALSMGVCGPTHDKRSWTFDLDPGGVDPVLGIPRIQDAYFKREPGYPRGITVPAFVDITTGAVVTNDFKQMTVDMETEWTKFHREGAPDLYPEQLRADLAPYLGQRTDDLHGSVPEPSSGATDPAVVAWLEERMPALLTAPRDAAGGEGVLNGQIDAHSTDR